MRSWSLSFSSGFGCVRVVQTERAQVANDPEGRERKTRQDRADQGEVRTEELGHATFAPFVA